MKSQERMFVVSCSPCCVPGEYELSSVYVRRVIDGYMYEYVLSRSDSVCACGAGYQQQQHFQQEKKRNV